MKESMIHNLVAKDLENKSFIKTYSQELDEAYASSLRTACFLRTMIYERDVNKPDMTLPKPYVDAPWKEIDHITTCTYCGKEQIEGTAMRLDRTGPVCTTCVVKARKGRTLW